MKSFKEIASEYQEIQEAAKMKKKKKYVPDEKGNLKKTIVKFCADPEGKKAEGYKLVGGKKCEKIQAAEKRMMAKRSKKIQMTKKKHAGKIAKNADKLKKKKMAKGLVKNPAKEEEK